MEKVIHAKSSPGKGLMFRVWDPENGKYVTKSLTEKAVSKAMERFAIEDAKKLHMMSITLRLATASINGSSDKTSKRQLTDPWEK